MVLLLSMDDDEGERPPASSSCLHPAMLPAGVHTLCIYVTQQVVLVRNGSERGGANDLASADDSSNWSGREKERESRRDVCIYGRARDVSSVVSG